MLEKSVPSTTQLHMQHQVSFGCPASAKGEIKSVSMQHKNATSGLSEDLCVRENPASPSALELECNLECDETYEKNDFRLDNSASLGRCSGSMVQVQVFPLGKNGKSRRVPLAPKCSPLHDLNSKSP